MEKNSEPKTHQGVSTELGRLFRKKLDSETTRNYSKIQTWREEVDYGTAKKFGKEKAEESVEFAEEFLAAVKKIT